MGSVDKTLFSLKHGSDFLLVQIYVDDIIFGASSHVLVSYFQKMMKNEFQMSMMRELTFFLGIQVKQMKQDTFVHQAKYHRKSPLLSPKLFPFLPSLFWLNADFFESCFGGGRGKGVA
jgi:hypothetical protein